MLQYFRAHTAKTRIKQNNKLKTCMKTNIKMTTQEITRGKYKY